MHLNRCDFDSFCHSASAISTGGLSTKNTGLVAFDNSAVEVVLMILMIQTLLKFTEESVVN